MSTYRLQPPAFRPLSPGEVRPTGWLQRQLRIQADGLSGHLDQFWPDVRDSQWFGGSAEAWERAPYWLDGVIPLAYALPEETLMDRVTGYLDHIVEHQHDDGWLGPREMIAASGQAIQPRYDLWGQILATKVLLQAYDATGDDRYRDALMRALQCIDQHIDRAPLFNWGQFRWFETLLSIAQLYEETGARWLIDLATKLRAQGFDWRSFFEAPGGWPAAAPTPKGRWNYMSHVVNNAMAVKAGALAWRFSGDHGDLDAPFTMIESLAKHHGMATGMFTGDECLAGRQPTHGSELCAVVEYAYSLEVLASIVADPMLGDHLERLIFNALPATFSPDMWSHQYDQQANQVLCSVLKGRIWNTNGPAANIFGVDPNYGCCTANLSQGWPKFATHLWMKPTTGEGLAAIAYAPSTVTTRFGGIPVTVALETDYPFREDLRFTITAEQPAKGALWLRIPTWAHGATLRQPDGAESHPQPGTYARVNRVWQGSESVHLHLPAEPELWRGYREAVAVRRGPLVFALKIGEDWRRINVDAPYRELPHADWEVYPTTPWAYGLDIGQATIRDDIAFARHPVRDLPFSPEGAPVTASVRGRKIPGWDLENGAAADVPQSPLAGAEPLETLTLIPYGCTNLRITEFPQLARSVDRPAD